MRDIGSSSESSCRCNCRSTNPSLVKASVPEARYLLVALAASDRAIGLGKGDLVECTGQTRCDAAQRRNWAL